MWRKKLTDNNSAIQLRIVCLQLQSIPLSLRLFFQEFKWYLNRSVSWITTFKNKIKLKRLLEIKTCRVGSGLKWDSASCQNVTDTQDIIFMVGKCCTTQELAEVHAVGQSHSVVGVNESYVEDSFHGRLIEAGEGLPGVRWLHLSRGHNSDKSR